MKSIRIGVFETNSSSTHSLTIATAEEFELFKAGEMVYDVDYQQLITKEEMQPEYILNGTNGKYDEDDSHMPAYLDHENYKTFLNCRGYESFQDKRTLPNGTNVVVFGYMGQGG